MQSKHVTLDDFLASELAGKNGESAAAGLPALLGEIAQAVSIIASLIDRRELERGTLAGVAREPIDIAARGVLAALCESCASIAGCAATGVGTARATAASARGAWLLAFDALDGAGQAGENGMAGSIFSVRAATGQAMGDEQGLLCEGAALRAAGYAVYGPSTILVLTLGRGTHGFTLARESGTFVLTHRSIRIPEEGAELSIDGARERCWAPPVLRYVRECREGSMGERGRDFSMRFSGCAVADVHRILVGGGLGIVPCEHHAAHGGGLSLVHAAQPLAWLVEQAGGAASTGRERVLELRPASLDERTGIAIGAECEVARLERYYREYERGVDRPFISPLFNERSLYRPEACA
ncbi:class 1 fructose-bisphosphatase [Paraburkholderia mimosarum]|uniref:class 1 fructose-bisphosphatase n=1 Tax=Paraburkholderia mimosarum TaxID=312026 RepID=UPI0004859897|nr:class 1 fructose-bisphosphatase [Paraburkholderia mimosarum]